MANRVFGDNLAGVRKKAGLSQEELAEKMRITIHIMKSFHRNMMMKVLKPRK